MKRLFITALIAFATISLAGCDRTAPTAPRTSSVNPATFQQQQQCAAAAKAWFDENFNTNQHGYSSHFNHKLNRCFIERRGIRPGSSSVTYIDDPVENQEYATLILDAGNTQCYFQGKNCTEDEFEKMKKALMSE